MVFFVFCGYIYMKLLFFKNKYELVSWCNEDFVKFLQCIIIFFNEIICLDLIYYINGGELVFFKKNCCIFNYMYDFYI